MYSSIYATIKSYQEVQGDMVERLEKHGLRDVFEPIIEKYGNDMDVFNAVLFYLINAYSRESLLHMASSDWSVIKEKAAEDAGLKDYDDVYIDCLHLKSSEFVTSVRMYLDKQKSKAFKHLMMLNELYNQMLDGAIENIQDKDGVVDYDQKKRNAEHADSLYIKIGEWEQKLVVQNENLNKVEDEMKNAERKFSLRMEDVAHEVRKNDHAGK